MPVCVCVHVVLCVCSCMSMCVQVDAIRRGFLSVVPSIVLDVCSWKELQERVCGNTYIDVDVMRRNCNK